MEIYLTQDQSTRRITDILLNWSWSGDKSTLVRQLVAEIVFDELTGLPVPQMGDAVMMTDQTPAIRFLTELCFAEAPTAKRRA